MNGTNGVARRPDRWEGLPIQRRRAAYHLRAPGMPLEEVAQSARIPAKHHPMSVGSAAQQRIKRGGLLARDE